MLYPDMVERLSGSRVEALRREAAERRMVVAVGAGPRRGALRASLLRVTVGWWRDERPDRIGTCPPAAAADTHPRGLPA